MADQKNFKQASVVRRRALSGIDPRAAAYDCKALKE